MHTSTMKSRHLGSASIAVALLAASADSSDLHNYHSNDTTEPVIVTFATDATARADGEINESSQNWGSYTHPVRMTDGYILNASSQAGGGLMSMGSAQIDASAQLESTSVEDDSITWTVKCNETLELQGGSANNPVSTSLDVSSTLWYTVDLLEAQEIVLSVAYKAFYADFFHDTENTVAINGNLSAWDGSEGVITGPPMFNSISDGSSLNMYGETYEWRIWLPAGRWRLQASFDGRHTRESVTETHVEESFNYFWYNAQLRPATPSYLTPDGVYYFEQGPGMLTASTVNGEKTDTNSVNEYNETVHATLGSEFMTAPWAASNISAIQHPLHWDDEGFYQTLDAQANLAANTAHPFETSSIQALVSSTPRLQVSVDTHQRIEISFSSEAIDEPWAEHEYDVIVTKYLTEDLPTEEIEPYSVSADGRRFKFLLTTFGNMTIEPSIQVEHSVTAQGWLAESRPHELITMRVRFLSRSDLTGDGLVNGSDLATLLAKWGVDSFEADLNGDGIVNGEDLARMLSDWG